MAFNVPINSIAPTPTPLDWVRPVDWITIIDTPNEVQFLVCDLGAKAFTITTTFIKNSGTNIYIDWGDGVVDTISNIASTNTSHVYPPGGTPCSRGYNTWKIRVYGDASCVITNARHIVNFAATGGNTFYKIGLLEAYFGDGSCSTNALTSSYFNSSTISNFQLLEYVKLPSTVAWTSQMSNMFNFCINLYKVIMPISASNLTELNSIFNNCDSLLDVALPSNATAITNLGTAFNLCLNLRTISFPTTMDNCTLMLGMCSNCLSLKNITLPSINLCTTLQSAFQTCESLQWIKFTSFPTPSTPGTTINFTTLFFQCFALQNVYLPASCSSNGNYTLQQAFANCYVLKNIVFPTNFQPSSLQSCFSSCFSITDIIFQSGSIYLTDMNNTFTNCYKLTNITLPTTVSSSGVNLTSTFSGCKAIANVTIPNAWLLTNLTQTFSGCFVLSSVNLPNNAQNSIITMQNTFSTCYKLKTVVLPTSLNSVISLSSTFLNCYDLISVVFPATMNAVTNISSCFQSCYNLMSVTLPTSMTSCTSFINTFYRTFNLKNLFMPANVPINTTYASITGECRGLETLTLPLTQTTSLTNISSLWSGATSLYSIGNLDKIGNPGTSTTYVNGSFNTNANLIKTLSFNCPFSVLGVNGQSATNFNLLFSLRLLNTSTGQYAGTSPQINVSYCDLGITALNQLFTDLPTITSKTINITGCTGAAGCTRSIATAKGWIVTG